MHLTGASRRPKTPATLPRQVISSFGERRMKTSRYVLALLAALMLSGCACTNYINNIGKTRTQLVPQAATIDSYGNIVCEVGIRRRSMNHYHSTTDLGRRYVIRNAPHGGEAIQKRVNDNRGFERKGKKYLEISAHRFAFPKTNADAKETPSWYIYPPDLTSRIPEPALPTYLRESTFKRYPYGGTFGSELEYIVDGERYLVDVEIDAQCPGHPDTIHQKKWAYPLKVLCVPAFVIDVVTFPIQVHVIGRKLGSL
jgi:hypothetical protein